MKKYIIPLLLITIIMVQAVSAQNLVPNPSFEDFDACPSQLSTVKLASMPTTYLRNWSRATEGSVDYHNACLPNGAYAGLPKNYMGYQHARTGNAYAGLYLYSFREGKDSLAYHEYLQTRLTTPMINRHRYFVSYWISPAELPALPEATEVMDQYDLLFLPDSVEIPNSPLLLNYTPQLTSPAGTIYGDTAGWTRISHFYTAAGRERWMLFGSFRDHRLLNRRIIIPAQGIVPGSAAYAYYDDVCIMDLDGTPTASFRLDTTICPQASITWSGREGANVYLWNDGDPNKEKTFSEAGTYWVKSITTDACSFTLDTVMVTVGIKQLKLPIGADTTICNNKPLIISAYHDSLTRYLWNTGDTTSGIRVNTPGTYYMQGSANCYEAVSDTISVSIIPDINFSLPDDTLLCRGTVMTLAADSIPYASRQWSTGAQSCCIDVTEAGTYTLTMTNVCELSLTQSVTINYTGCEDCFFIPNAFSPNGDGRNDLFRVRPSCLIDKFSLSIFNRWGQRVFKTDNPASGWDGSVNGQPAELGTYYLYLEAEPEFTWMEKIRIKTDITLIR